MKHNSHSQRIWHLIGQYAQQWNLANWNLFSEQVVSFTINYGSFHGAISMQEITNANSLQYGKVAVAFQAKGMGFPNLTFQRPWDVSEFIEKLGAVNVPVTGERAPKDYPNACSPAR